MARQYRAETHDRPFCERMTMKVRAAAFRIFFFYERLSASDLIETGSDGLMGENLSTVKIHRSVAFTRVSNSFNSLCLNTVTVRLS